MTDQCGLLANSVLCALMAAGCFDPSVGPVHCGIQDICPSGRTCDFITDICIANNQLGEIPCDEQGKCPPGRVCDASAMICALDGAGEFTITPSLDMLFIIDNSGSMAEEQAALTAQFDTLVAPLAALGGQLPDLHIGVVSTDMGVGPNLSILNCDQQGDAGALQNQPRIGGCTPPDGLFLSDSIGASGDRIRNYTGTLRESFECIARLGSDGCGFEQPLESMMRALSDDTTGFLREHAGLALIFLSDEDDCSTADTNLFDTSQTAPDSELGPLTSFRCFEFGVACEPEITRTVATYASCAPQPDSPYLFGVDRYVDFVRGLKPSPAQIAAAGIAGDAAPVQVVLDPDTGNPELAPSCSSEQGVAAPAVRLHAFIDAFTNTVTNPVCDADLSDVLTRFGQSLATITSAARQCPMVIEPDAGSSGSQLICEVTRTAPGPATWVPQCTDQGPPLCWLLQPNEACEPAGMELVVLSPVVGQTSTQEFKARCFTAS